MCTSQMLVKIKLIINLTPFYYKERLCEKTIQTAAVGDTV